MNVKMSLVEPASSEAVPQSLSDDARRHVGTFLIDACVALEDAGYTFVASGLGFEEQYFEVGYELPMLLEQIPEFIQNLAHDDEGVVEFYGQGAENTFTFCVSGEPRVVWRSGAESPREEVLLTAFVSALDDVVNQFLSAAERVGFSAHLPAVASWRSSWESARRAVAHGS